MMEIDGLVKELKELKEQTSLNGTKLDALDTKIDNMPVEIKQNLFPQIITEIRNSIRSELERKF